MKYCGECGRPSTSSHGERCSQINDEWLIRCRTCRYSRRYGQSRMTAHHAADKHARNNPLHTVHIMHGGVIVEVRLPKRFLETLPFGVDEPPF